MNFYDQLNHYIDLLEQNLSSKIDYQALAAQVNLNFTTLQKVFPLLTGMTLAEYVRGRRLTLAAKDLVQSELRIIDIALQYGYESAAAFSRAFMKFHQMMPSEAKQRAGKLKSLSKLAFAPPQQVRPIAYEVVELPELTLKGLEIISDHNHIGQDAPALYARLLREYPDLPHPDYGMLEYGLGRDDDDDYHYFVLWQDAEHWREGFEERKVPARRWLRFCINSQTAEDIQRVSRQFYEEFLLNCDYRLRPEPELEYYHDGVTDFLIPIY